MDGESMKCQDCNEQEAHVHMTQIINNEKTSLHLCKKCAAARGFNSPLDDLKFPLAEIIQGFDPGILHRKKGEAVEQITCPNCGLTFEKFAQQGRFGCGECYKAFRSRLEKLMRQIHGASLHRGRSPVTTAPDNKETSLLPVKEEERLEAELQKAIDTEDFERAAEIRDKLKTVRHSLTTD